MPCAVLVHSRPRAFIRCLVNLGLEFSAMLTNVCAQLRNTQGCLVRYGSICYD